MFSEISFTGLKQSESFGYATNLEFFKTNKKVEFKPGLNILFGPNGCGKSTILRMLARTMSAEQGGRSVVTQESLRDVVPMKLEKPKDDIVVKVAHDGQPVLYCDSRKAVGLMGGSFDDDFFHEGVTESMSKSNSSGEASVRRMARVLQVLAGKEPFPAKVEYKISPKGLNSHWKQIFGILEERMAGNIPVGQKTVLLDEPEANMSVLNQIQIWLFLHRVAKEGNFQLIVATHSPFVLSFKEAHYVDLVKGYLDECRLGFASYCKQMVLDEPAA